LPGPEVGIADVHAGRSIKESKSGGKSPLSQVRLQGAEQVPQQQRNEDEEDNLKDDPQNPDIAPEWRPLWRADRG
jgi:hypothetical protein